MEVPPMKAVKQRIWIHKNEVIDSIELYHKDKRKLYSITYKVAWKKNELLPVMRWDNLDHRPHIDKYDQSGNLIEQRPTREKSLKEIADLISLFRKNIISLDLSDI